MYINKVKTILITLIALFLIAGCGTFSKSKKETQDDSVDYKNARSIPVLRLPAK